MSSPNGPSPEVLEMEKIAALKREAANDSSVINALVENLLSSRAYHNGVPPSNNISNEGLPASERIFLVKRLADDRIVNPAVQSVPRRDGGMGPTESPISANEVTLPDQYAA